MLAGMSESILARVPGPFLAAALQKLPPAETATVDVMITTIDVPRIGSVHVTAKRVKARRGKSSHYFWTPGSAAAVDPASPPAATSAKL
jgi:hypothetical protein